MSDAIRHYDAPVGPPDPRVVRCADFPRLTPDAVRAYVVELGESDPYAYTVTNRRFSRRHAELDELRAQVRSCSADGVRVLRVTAYTIRNRNRKKRTVASEVIDVPVPPPLGSVAQQHGAPGGAEPSRLFHRPVVPPTGRQSQQ